MTDRFKGLPPRNRKRVGEEEPADAEDGNPGRSSVTNLYGRRRRVTRISSSPLQRPSHSPPLFLGLPGCTRCSDVDAGNRQASASPRPEPRSRSASSDSDCAEDVRAWAQPKQRSRLQSNMAGMAAWNAAMPDLIAKRVEYIGAESSETTSESLLSAKIGLLVSHAAPACESCGALCRCELVESGFGKIIVVDISAHVCVWKPSFSCCGVRRAVHPLDIDMFPATPQQPGAYFTVQLLELVDSFTSRGHVSAGRKRLQRLRSLLRCFRLPNAEPRA